MNLNRREDIICCLNEMMKHKMIESYEFFENHVMMTETNPNDWDNELKMMLLNELDEYTEMIDFNQFKQIRKINEIK